MTQTLTPRETARFLRTLRISTYAAIAADDLRRDVGRPTSAARFLALAAKGADDWRFPEAGLASANGLLEATVTRDGTTPAALVLQAQGASGLAAFAQRAAEIRIGPALTLAGQFDRNGRMSVALPADGVDETELSRFEIDLVQK